MQAWTKKDNINAISIFLHFCWLKSSKHACLKDLESNDGKKKEKEKSKFFLLFFQQFRLAFG
jgi:hypothetical protein